MSSEIFNAILVQETLKIFVVCLAFFLSLVFFRFLEGKIYDRKKNKFELWINEANNLELAIFFSARLIGICILIGFAIS